MYLNDMMYISRMIFKITTVVNKIYINEPNSMIINYKDPCYKMVPCKLTITLI